MRRVQRAEDPEMGELGRVESAESGLPWRVIFPDVEHTGATSYLRELAASDCEYGCSRRRPQRPS
ncbi:hypothetical protein BVC93_14125 [Mycobacterium sp. MS1601]|nr:hypothetical protein BVC93_14125 [Mycobacterium sp. MS1601]